MPDTSRSEEHTSELQSHSEISYAVFCLKKKNRHVRSEEHTSEPQSHSEISYAVVCLKTKNAPKAPAAHSTRWCWQRKRRPWNSAGPVRRCPPCTTPQCAPFFFFSGTATTEIYTNLNTLSLHDALPISLLFAWEANNNGKKSCHPLLS